PRLMGLLRKQRQRSPSGRAAGQPCAAPASAASATSARQLQSTAMSRLHRAAARGDLAWLRRWRWALRVIGIDSPDQEKRTPLHLACANGHVDVVRFLVRQNCQLNPYDNWRRSPLMKAVQSQREECVAVLLEHGASPNLQDTDGNTALHLAVLSNDINIVLLLLEHHADIDAENREGCTPLMLAVWEHHKDVAVLLLLKGADVHAPDLYKRTPLMIAASDGQLDLVRILLQFGADVFQEDIVGRTAKDYAILYGYSGSGRKQSEESLKNLTEEELPLPHVDGIVCVGVTLTGGSQVMLAENHNYHSSLLLLLDLVVIAGGNEKGIDYMMERRCTKSKSGWLQGTTNHQENTTEPEDSEVPF
ncbi:PREDICTED: ankyrin repeat domain-containing protein 7-like, partial [Chaetura pelagica]